MTKANSTLESDPAVLSTLVTKILVLLALLPRGMEGVSLGANGADSSLCHRGSEQKSAGDQRVERPFPDPHFQVGASTHPEPAPHIPEKEEARATLTHPHFQSWRTPETGTAGPCPGLKFIPALTSKRTLQGLRPLKE
ncbi:uncharacterized protein LOC116898035 [Rattus rattus]|uniref:uncharacterized protein LOC116898035 n=1 Tax=Rattus rattus TaxID=10117 RepID=UPI0013F32281|nr:uncharacterized protein LOC116898035 [Rattus rattus]